MKKYLNCFLAFLMIVILFGCSNKTRIKDVENKNINENKIVTIGTKNSKTKLIKVTNKSKYDINGFYVNKDQNASNENLLEGKFHVNQKANFYIEDDESVNVTETENGKFETSPYYEIELNYNGDKVAFLHGFPMSDIKSFKIRNNKKDVFYIEYTSLDGMTYSTKESELKINQED